MGRKLYVLGNGFDVAHGLKTSYKDFMMYLYNEDDCFLGQFNELYSLANIDLDDWHYINYKDSYFNDQYNYFWCDMENNLGKNVDRYIESIMPTEENMPLDSGFIGVEDTIDNYMQDNTGFIDELSDKIHDWIRTIKLKNVCLINNNLKNNEMDMFLTFNYTRVLEDVYNIDDNNILHIHGSVDGDVSPIIGHGNIKEIERLQEEENRAIYAFDEGSTCFYRAIKNVYENTFKDTETITITNQFFFNQLKDISDIIVFGHSLNDIDMPYFYKIKQVVSPNTIWTMYYHSDKDKKAIEKFVDKIQIKRSRLQILKSNEFINI